MHRYPFTFTGLVCLAIAAHANAAGVSAGATYWNFDISGTARYKTGNSANDIDVDHDLGYKDGSSNVFQAALEHPVPILPNLRLAYTDIDENASGRLTKSVVYGGTTFQADEAVSSSVRLKQTDVTLYYSLLKSVLDLDLGMTAKYVDSKLRITGATSGTETAQISAWVPMVYAGVGVDLPLRGLSLGAEGSGVTYSGSRFYDFTVRANYLTAWRLGIDVGYRRVRLDLDDFDDSFAKVTFEGPFAGAYLHF